jgi:hypothetical protein
MAEPEPRETLGMTEDELQRYFEELLLEQAEEVSEDEGTPPAQVMASPGFAATRASMSYAVQLIAANNAYLTRHLLDLGLLPQAVAGDEGDE